MGTAGIQGELWGAKAEEWAAVQEPTWRPVYETVLAHAGVGAGTRLLDVGCGAGGALVAARQLGTEVAGLDASHALVAIARRRLPGARIEIGEMEALPFDDGTFDVVTGFNSFQFAGNVVGALGEARRVCRDGGTVAVLIWGPKESSDLSRVTMPAVAALLPPPPAPTGPAQPPISTPGVIEALLEQAGLSPVGSGDFGCAFTYPDRTTAWRAISSAGAVVRAARLVGEDQVRDAVLASFERFVRSDGSVLQHNSFHWVTARSAGAPH